LRKEDFFFQNLTGFSLKAVEKGRGAFRSTDVNGFSVFFSKERSFLYHKRSLCPYQSPSLWRCWAISYRYWQIKVWRIFFWSWAPLIESNWLLYFRKSFSFYLCPQTSLKLRKPSVFCRFERYFY